MPNIAVYVDLDYLGSVSPGLGSSAFDTAMQIYHFAETLGYVTEACAYSSNIGGHDAAALRSRQYNLELKGPAMAGMFNDVTKYARRKGQELPAFILASDIPMLSILEYLENAGAEVVVIADTDVDSQKQSTGHIFLPLWDVLRGSETIMVKFRHPAQPLVKNSGSRVRPGSKAPVKDIEKPQDERKLLREFLCHASADKPAVRALHAKLRADGFQPWLDEEDILPGEDWEHKISAAVRDSAVVLVCLSLHSTTKEGFVQKEIKYALDVADEKPEGTVFIIPVRLEDCDVPSRLRRWQWVNLFEENGYKRLCQTLRSRCQDGKR
jgi:hypothetical protein